MLPRWLRGNGASDMVDICKTTGKVSFLSYKKAKEQVRLHIKHDTIHHNRFIKMIPYRCEYCGKWHLTSHDHSKRLKHNLKKLSCNRKPKYGYAEMAGA